MDASLLALAKSIYYSSSGQVIYFKFCNGFEIVLDMGTGLWLGFRKTFKFLISYLVFTIASRVSNKYFGSSC